MAWKKAAQGLVETFEAVRPRAPAEARQMFGYPCCFVNGNMFMGLHEDRMILRLDETERERLLAMEGAEPFEPMPGRPMREYVVVPPALLTDHPTLRGWVDRSLAYARALPPKGKAATGKAAAKAPAPAPERKPAPPKVAAKAKKAPAKAKKTPAKATKTPAKAKKAPA